jgi:ubiquinone/menaquinone biosynthesis C-methylase UbiE
LSEGEDPHRIVAEGYDRIAAAYERRSVEGRTPETYYRRFTDRAIERIPVGGRVLDLGCGAGIVAAELVPRARVVGVDLSWQQLRLARRRAPAAMLVHADMTRLAFVDRSFDAVAMFWSLIHVRRDRHAEVLAAAHRWLRSGGVLFGTFGSGDNPDERDPDFFGAPMYWSHYDAESDRTLLSAAGFDVVQADVIEDQDERHLWVIATA